MQSKYLLALGLCLSACVSTPSGKDGQDAAKGASSEIPERREFPVSDNIKPCDDFYQYACKEVVDNFKLRPDRSRHTFAFSDSRERLLEKKKAFLRTRVRNKFCFVFETKTTDSPSRSERKVPQKPRLLQPSI